MGPPTLFRVAPPRSALQNVLWTAAQCAGVWSVTLVLAPLLLVALERRLGVPPMRSLHAPVVGAILFVAFSALNLWAGARLSVHGEGTPLPISAPRRLVLSGPYRYVRNPMAMAGIGQGVAVGLWFGSWVVLTYALTGAIVWHYGLRPAEERDLLARFGAGYSDYRAAVPLWRARYPGYAPPGG